MDLERAQWKESRRHVGLFYVKCFRLMQGTSCQVGLSFKPVAGRRVEAGVVRMFNRYKRLMKNKHGCHVELRFLRRVDGVIWRRGSSVAVVCLKHTVL